MFGIVGDHVTIRGSGRDPYMYRQQIVSYEAGGFSVIWNGGGKNYLQTFREGDTTLRWYDLLGRCSRIGKTA